MATIQDKTRKSPLINSTCLLPQGQTKLLVSCCNVNGGLYVIAFSESRFSYKKIIDGDCRGLARYGDGFVVPTNTYGILLLDHAFKIISQYKPDSFKDYHGVAVEGDYAYIVETSINTIGKFKLPELERVGEYVLDPRMEDICHVNDIFIDENKVYLSMFSYDKKWRDCSIDSGVVVKADLDDFSNMEILFSGLKKPHSIRPVNGIISICNSSNFEVLENDKRIFKSSGYLRGIEKIDNTYFFGQSESRNVEFVRKENTNISLDSGIHVFHAIERISRFFPLPSPEIYAIMDCNNASDPSAYEHAEKIIHPEINRNLCWQLFIDTGDGFNEEQSIIFEYSSLISDLSIDLSEYTNIKALRFDPANRVCLFSLNNITAETEIGTESLLINSHNAISINQTQYYFDHDDPQLIINNVNPAIKTFSIRFDLYVDCIGIGSQMINQINQYRQQLSGNDN